MWQRRVRVRSQDGEHLTPCVSRHVCILGEGAWVWNQGGAWVGVCPHLHLGDDIRV